MWPGSNSHDHLPDGFGHQLWLILVDVVAAVLGDEEAGIRDERRQILVRRTQDRFQRIGREPLSLLRRTSNGRAWARTASGIGPKRRGRRRLAHRGVIFAVSDRLEIAVAGMVFTVSLPDRTLNRTRAAHRSGVSSVSSLSE